MRVVSIVEACLHHLDVVLGNGRLLGKLLAQEVGYEVEVAIEKPAHQSESEHVAAFQDGLVVEAAVGQTVLHHGGERALDDAVGVYAQLGEVVVGLESCFLQVVRTEGVGVDDDGGLRFCIAQLRLQRGGVHGYEDIAEITRRVYLAGTDVYLETADTCERPLRGADVGGIVGNVEIPLPTVALTVEKMFPASCIPSPESPEKRTTTWSSSLTSNCSAIYKCQSKKQIRLQRSEFLLKWQNITSQIIQQSGGVPVEDTPPVVL